MTPEARVRTRVSRPIRELTSWAWIGVVGIHVLSLGTGGALLTAHQHTVDVGVGGVGGVGVGVGGVGGVGGVPAGWLGIVSFTVMVAAMMLPLLTAPLQHVLARTLPARRDRHLFWVVAVHGLVWSVGMLVLHAAGSVARGLAGPGLLLVVGVTLVLVWEISPVRQRCVNRHHAHPPLAVHGRSADWSVLRYAVGHASWCLASCWPVMLLPLLTGGWQLPMMAVASVWMWLAMIDEPGPAVWSLRPWHRLRRLAHMAAWRYAVRFGGRFGGRERDAERTDQDRLRCTGRLRTDL